MKALFIFLGGILSSCAIEKPKYETIQKDGDFEVRKYAAIKVVSAPMDDMAKRDVSFRKLFKYISGENADKQKFFAFYDPPWTPELLRRNEIWQKITP